MKLQLVLFYTTAQKIYISFLIKGSGHPILENQLIWTCLCHKSLSIDIFSNKNFKVYNRVREIIYKSKQVRSAR